MLVTVLLCYVHRMERDLFYACKVVVGFYDEIEHSCNKASGSLKAGRRLPPFTYTSPQKRQAPCVHQS